MAYRIAFIVGLQLLLAAGLLTWQGGRELPLWLAGGGLLLMLPLLNRAVNRTNRLPAEAERRRPFTGG